MHKLFPLYFTNRAVFPMFFGKNGQSRAKQPVLPGRQGIYYLLMGDSSVSSSQGSI